MRFIHGSLEHYCPLIDVLVSTSEIGQIKERHAHRALIDTGATRTAVSDRIVALYGLPPRGKMLTRTAMTMAARRPSYAFELSVFCRSGQSDDLPVEPYGLDHEFAAPPFLGNEAFDVLIGMDLLSQGRLVIDRQEFSFAF